MPWLPRLQVYEIDDQTWYIPPASPPSSLRPPPSSPHPKPRNSTNGDKRFPSFLRAHIQNALTLTWTTPLPLSRAPAVLAAEVLQSELPGDLSSYTFVDFCAGGGGPTPEIERVVNGSLRAREGRDDGGVGGAGEDGGEEEAREAVFVMTDLFPNVESWKRLVRGRKSLFFEEKSVDARDGGEVVKGWKGNGRVCRLFNLAFHHFDDELAGDILKDTLENSDAFA